jgi:regulator of RNase E activity RraA
MAIGFAVLRRERAVSQESVERFREFPLANVSDCMNRLEGGAAAIRPINDDPHVKMAGVALTVKTRPGDNLMVHKALSMAGPGDALVVDAGGDLTNAILGEIMIAAAVSRGVAGVVVDGAIRDAAAIRGGAFPVFARGVTHRGPYKDGPGEVNGVIAISGMVISPGDLIIGDADGVLCVPIDEVDKVYECAKAKLESEQKAFASIAAGQREDSWIDQRLQSLGVQVSGTFEEHR